MQLTLSSLPVLPRYKIEEITLIYWIINLHYKCLELLPNANSCITKYKKKSTKTDTHFHLILLDLQLL